MELKDYTIRNEGATDLFEPLPLNEEVSSIPPSAISLANYSPSEPRKRRLTYVVWNHFQRNKVGEIEQAICNYCEK